MIGAILTQNTSWKNVEKAITTLKDAGMLDLDTVMSLPVALLAEYIRPSGYYNIKAGRIHNLCRCIKEYGQGTEEDFLCQPQEKLRRRLLEVKGIGPETADSIILYAAKQPVFVVDAYTFRVLSRHQYISDEAGYEELQAVFMDNLEHDTALFNEFHALMVCVGKFFCKKSKPDCEQCPLKGI